MNFKYLYLLVTSFLLFSFNLPKEIQKKVDKEIMEVFHIEDFEFSEVLIPTEETKNLPSAFGSDNLFKIKSNNNLLGYAYVSKAPSKTDRFDN
jgi:hypothetical protein